MNRANVKLQIVLLGRSSVAVGTVKRLLSRVRAHVQDEMLFSLAPSPAEGTRVRVVWGDLWGARRRALGRGGPADSLESRNLAGGTYLLKKICPAGS